MVKEARDGKDVSRIDANALPDSVARLWETMLRLDPNWNLSNWLDEKAVEELELVESHLGRERLRLEQRLHRIETLVKRLRRQREVADNIVLSDPNQRNLFDVYETTEVVKQNAEDQHREPMVDFGALDFDDDPLLAIVAEHIMAFMENEKSSGKMVIHFKQLLKQFIPLSIREEEIDEAISILLQKKMIIEIDQDIFGLEN
ncbi:MAG: hypothetical protein HOD35_07110 [Euryarchaeota archaeon]|jgi:hypothetical protein|nr:hypothetical protein [Euryarchaeota archaeon]MBT4392406.1 hypothetical protein [Euryarchaeota archaeon]MBT4803328.1 hypothetical protein [Euryarchaeota archaeon]MBT6683847.1 hypothetical protein [Euryarchaeota archaeon]MBT6873956.1 hypothetical protein [Euryarchaeota archaeon]